MVSLRATIVCLLHAFTLAFVTKRYRRVPFRHNSVPVWIEEAEEGFVDHDENLEEGEECWRAVKAFAQTIDDDRQLLGAGALVERPTGKCDIWMADSLLDNPNLQIQGTLLILDDLFGTYIQNTSTTRNLFVQCGRSNSEYTCASYQAAILRGFRPMTEVVDDAELLDDEMGTEGLCFDQADGLSRYQKACLVVNGVGSESAARVLSLLQIPGLTT